MQKENKTIIWQDIDIDPDIHQEFFDEFYPDATEAERWEMAVETNANYLDDERDNLNKPAGGRIVVFADVGLWYGRRDGYKILDSDRLSGIFNLDDGCDYHEFTLEDGECCGAGIHHDGRNNYIFRALRADLDDDTYNAALENDLTFDELWDATRSIAHDIAEIYGTPIEYYGTAEEIAAAKSAKEKEAAA